MELTPFARKYDLDDVFPFLRKIERLFNISRAKVEQDIIDDSEQEELKDDLTLEKLYEEELVDENIILQAWIDELKSSSKEEYIGTDPV